MFLVDFLELEGYEQYHRDPDLQLLAQITDVLRDLADDSDVIPDTSYLFSAIPTSPYSTETSLQAQLDVLVSCGHLWQVAEEHTTSYVPPFIFDEPRHPDGNFPSFQAPSACEDLARIEIYQQIETCTASAALLIPGKNFTYEDTKQGVSCEEMDSEPRVSDESLSSLPSADWFEEQTALISTVKLAEEMAFEVRLDRVPDPDIVQTYKNTTMKRKIRLKCRYIRGEPQLKKRRIAPGLRATKGNQRKKTLSQSVPKAVATEHISPLEHRTALHDVLEAQQEPCLSLPKANALDNEPDELSSYRALGLDRPLTSSSITPVKPKLYIVTAPKQLSGIFKSSMPSSVITGLEGSLETPVSSEPVRRSRGRPRKTVRFDLPEMLEPVISPASTGKHPGLSSQGPESIVINQAGTSNRIYRNKSPQKSDGCEMLC